MPSPEVEAALEKQNIQVRLCELEKQVLSQKTELDGLKAQRDRDLRYGTVALGTAVVGMGTWIINLFTGGHIK